VVREKIARNVFFDVRKLPVGVFSDAVVVTDSESFVHNEYASGRPNSSFCSTTKGHNVALKNIMPTWESTLFGSHIRETINEFRYLFCRR